jgi:hypothetical protein
MSWSLWTCYVHHDGSVYGFMHMTIHPFIQCRFRANSDSSPFTPDPSCCILYTAVSNRMSYKPWMLLRTTILLLVCMNMYVVMSSNTLVSAFSNVYDLEAIQQLVHANDGITRLATFIPLGIHTCSEKASHLWLRKHGTNVVQRYACMPHINVYYNT